MSETQQKGPIMTDEKLILFLRGCSSDEAMWSIEAANRIEALGNTCKEWAEVSQSKYQRAKAAEARAEQAEARVTELEATNHALRAALDVARTQDREPDYCYDCYWEYTMGWDQWPELVDGADSNEPMPIYTLYKGPRKWAAQVAVSWDADGHAEFFDAKIFDTEEAARAALSREGGE